MSRNFVVVFFSALLVGVACAAKPPPTLEEIDARAILPDKSLRKDSYVRVYWRTAIERPGGLPFTTGTNFSGFPAPRQVWIAIYRKPYDAEAAGIRIVTKSDQLPRIVHFGCGVVNLVADAETGETLLSYCNVEEFGDTPQRIRPHYEAKGWPVD